MPSGSHWKWITHSSRYFLLLFSNSSIVSSSVLMNYLRASRAGGSTGISTCTQNPNNTWRGKILKKLKQVVEYEVCKTNSERCNFEKSEVNGSYSNSIPMGENNITFWLRPQRNKFIEG